MSMQQSKIASRVDQLKIHLEAGRYSAYVQRRYPPIARRFLTYVESINLAVDAVRPCDVERFRMRELRAFRKRHGRSPHDILAWSMNCTTPVLTVLRLVHGRWPVALAPATAVESFHRDVVGRYDTWMRELRGLAPETRSARTTEASRFLDALSVRGDQVNLEGLNVPEIDSYIKWRCAGLCRRSIQAVTSNLRAFLRHLHSSGEVSCDLSETVIGPRIYDDEDIPSALRPEEVEKVLEVTHQDLSPAGRRDYAMLMLLATYGLRAGEIIKLRLEDIDWRNEVLHVRHSKTGAYSELPMLRAPGEAILNYLKEGRPKSAHREVFLCANAPYQPFRNVKSLYSAVQRRLSAAGVVPSGKRGPHAFRHARAVGMLRASVPLKTIGDVLGHRVSRTTGVYLKLATADLRSVGLEIPRKVLP
jgi:integrase/recombinase XerD